MIAAHGTFSEIVVIRLDPGEDVFEGILRYCKEHAIKNGVLLALHGSLKKASFFNVVPKPDLAMQYGYTDPMILDDICELIGGSGTVTHEEDGTINIHVHCSYSDRGGKAWGGHLIPGNEVLLVAEIMIGVVKGAEMLGIRNETGGVLFTPVQL